jgi:transposase-like protein
MNEKKCPSCGAESKQHSNGHNRSGTQRIWCRHCGKTYTIEPKQREYPSETKDAAIKMYYSGVSGRGVANYFGFNKSNVVRWLKKTDSRDG